jgi:hypothetical protein
VDAREPPIATLPRQARPIGPGARSDLARADGAGTIPCNPIGGAWKRGVGGFGYARHAALLERRLGWILWGGLFALVLARSV